MSLLAQFPLNFYTEWYKPRIFFFTSLKYIPDCSQKGEYFNNGSWKHTSNCRWISRDLMPFLHMEGSLLSNHSHNEKQGYRGNVCSFNQTVHLHSYLTSIVCTRYLRFRLHTIWILNHFFKIIFLKRLDLTLIHMEKEVSRQLKFKAFVYVWTPLSSIIDCLLCVKSNVMQLRSKDEAA